jgi:MFS family permease
MFFLRFLQKVKRSNSFTETAFELEVRPDPQTPLADTSSAVSEHQNETPSPPHTVFRDWERYFLVSFCSYLAVFSSISIPIYLPALPDIETEFNVTTEKINLTVVTYTIFQGLGPAFWCPISDRFGKRIVYILCIIVYIGACVGLALAPSYGALLGLRALQAAGMAASVAIGSGVIGDITTRQDRGNFVGIFSGFNLVGSAVGPIIGGALTSSFGSWRSIFWFLVIACGVSCVLLIVAFPETARFLVGNGSIKPKWVFAQSPIMILRGLINSAMKQKTYNTREEAKEKGLLADTVHVSMIATFRIVCYKDVAMILIPIGLHYTAWFMVITAQSTLLQEEYNFSVMNVGVSYLANGAGSVVGSLVSGQIMNFVYKIHANR